MAYRRAFRCFLFTISSLVGSFSTSAQNLNLIQLSDSELSEVQGQALLSMTYIAPNDSLNKMVGKGVGFYKLGLEALLELNANIRKLQLGCGGINGPGGCDLDIDNLSLSGLSETRNGRVGSSAEMSNPFIEFAIRNPESAAQREVLGLRMSAEKVKGLLTLGLENTGTPNGINSFSGYMKIQDATGTAYTQAREMTYDDTGMMLRGKMKLTSSDLSSERDYESSEYKLQLSRTRANLRISGQEIIGNRLRSVTLKGMADIGNIDLKGNIHATVQKCVVFECSPMDMSVEVEGYVSNVKANVSIDQNLGFIHKLPLNNPFSLSLQSALVHWPGASAAAQQGWWMAFEDAIDIGNVSPSKSIVITDDVLKQMVGPINKQLNDKPAICPFGACLIFGLDLEEIDVKGAVVDFPLKDLQLRNQNFAPNCYGNLKFC
ncbi:hypothetical protein EC844_10291 [Acinetobacter calcoaceticus]|uniref:Uncharacterized protein n=1 Tax=Acinetobacter calcoaceticus TaxID=471 RepID=A0A4R1XYK7_ACICA|nr:hypothetical protein EC844_10291 [Acinetobacter calcoaceticus]